MSRGRKNAYVCRECRERTVTVQLEDGTTPFLIPCTRPACEGMAESSFGRVDPRIRPTHAWYRPTGHALGRLSEPVREYVRGGGLILMARGRPPRIRRPRRK